jgi:hypothetical protein
MHCHPLPVSVAVVLTLVFAIGLAETTPLIDLTVKGFYLLFSILLSRMHIYYLWLLIWVNKGQNTQPSFTRGKLPLTAPVAPVTL